VSGNGIRWAICTSAPRPRQIISPAPHHSVFRVRLPFLLPNQQHQCTEGTVTWLEQIKAHITVKTYQWQQAFRKKTVAGNPLLHSEQFLLLRWCILFEHIVRLKLRPRWKLWPTRSRHSKFRLRRDAMTSQSGHETEAMSLVISIYYVSGHFWLFPLVVLARYCRCCYTVIIIDCDWMCQDGKHDVRDKRSRCLRNTGNFKSAPGVCWHCCFLKLFMKNHTTVCLSFLWARWDAGMVICLAWGADLHMAQLILLALTISCFSKIQIGFTFLVPADLGNPR